jgi:putative membrane protein
MKSKLKSSVPALLKTKLNSTLILLGIAALALGTVSCQNNENDSPAVIVSEQDRAYARNTAYSNLAEVSMGQLALSKSTNPAVREFAEMMVNDHNTAQAELRELSASLQIQLPDTLKTEDRMIEEGLSILEGGAFDNAYMNAQVLAHEQSRDVQQEQIEQGVNVELREYATTALNRIQSHLEMARQLRDQLLP